MLSIISITYIMKGGIYMSNSIEERVKSLQISINYFLMLKNISENYNTSQLLKDKITENEMLIIGDIIKLSQKIERISEKVQKDLPVRDILLIAEKRENII